MAYIMVLSVIIFLLGRVDHNQIAKKSTPSVIAINESAPVIIASNQLKLNPTKTISSAPLTKSQLRISRLKKKYPFVLIGNDDHGILSEADLWYYSNSAELFDEPYISPTKDFHYAPMGTFYFQCFERKAVTINLTEYGYSDLEWSGKENMTRLELYAETYVNGVAEYHTYFEKYSDSISHYKKIMRDWENTMLHQKYVCILGTLVINDSKIDKENDKEKYYSWEFYDMKTKKECDEDCEYRAKIYKKHLKHPEQKLSTLIKKSDNQ